MYNHNNFALHKNKTRAKNTLLTREPMTQLAVIKQDINKGLYTNALEKLKGMPKSDEWYFLSARCHRDLGRYHIAETQFRRIKQMTPEYQYHLGIGHLKQNNVEKAFYTFESIKKTSHYRYLGLAQCHHAKGNYQGCIEEYKKIFSYQSNVNLRAPARRRSPCTGRRTCSTATGAGSRAAGCSWSGPSPVFMSYVDRVLPSLGEETAELRSLGEVVRRRPHRPARPAGAGRAEGIAADAAVPAAGPARAPAGRADRAAHRLRRRGAAAGRRRPGPAAARLHERLHHPNAAGPEVRRGLVAALWAVRPRGGRRGRRRRSPTSSTTGTSSSASPAPGGRCSRRPRCSAGSATPTGSGTRARTGSRAADAQRAGRGPGARTPSVADVALVDELRVLLGEPPRPSPPARPQPQ